MPKLSGCNSCTHPTCAHSLINLGVSSCIECDRGVLVLDCTTTSKKWKLGCNSCDVIIKLFKDATKVQVETNCCDECGAQLMSVVYKSENTKFKDGKTEKTGCIFCHPDFVPLVERHKAVPDNIPQQNARGRGRGRGRGGESGRGGRNVDKMTFLATYFV